MGLQIDYVEMDMDPDGDVALTLSVITDDPQILARARRAMRAVLDDTPRLASVPLRQPERED
jgi:hypothetical protein